MFNVALQPPQSAEHTERSQPPTPPSAAAEEEGQATVPSLVTKSTHPGAKTSDFYAVKDIPERFNHPGELHVQLYNYIIYM